MILLKYLKKVDVRYHSPKVDQNMLERLMENMIVPKYHEKLMENMIVGLCNSNNNRISEVLAPYKNGLLHCLLGGSPDIMIKYCRT